MKKIALIAFSFAFLSFVGIGLLENASKQQAMTLNYTASEPGGFISTPEKYV
ncbi:uncharacterized protein KNN_02085 [Bacillus thuringiensis serovar tolworthi]|uniref:Uncharacterized protein n=1 Tax=Bacillus thuringiensis subsp. tolworthi TaxID=1442 RepID=A0A9W4ET83_BACTO|nr:MULTISPECIES: hypothetical protein [Bacillus cereus group]MEB9591155.1 hypothetical protein [Bacillus cereus]MRC49449.1 hypothetical protein [Bacillus thuringiensis]BAR82931.1 uncharacterized protein KNN_02085 [Bacillus thuringiensis serovar tolworthi]